MASSLSSALSSMEEMLDALMQRGIGKPDQDKSTKEEPPPALPSRPTVRGRPPSSSSQRPGPWLHRPPQEERSSFNLEMERRAVKAEEDARLKDDDVRMKDEEIGVLRQQVEHYERRLSEFEVKMKSVEEELQKQITALQIAQSTRPSMRSGGSSSSDEQQRRCERETTEVVVVEEDSMDDELQMLKRQFSIWKKEYEAELAETKAELKKRVDNELQELKTTSSSRRWWRKKVSTAKCKPYRWCCTAPNLHCCHCPTSCWRCPTLMACTWRCPTTSCRCHWPTSNCCHWPCSFSKCFRRCC